MSDAERIAYRALSVHLTNPEATFVDARNATILAATDLFGNGSCEVKSTIDAWYAVGVGGPYQSNMSISGFTFICDASVYTVDNLPAAATVTWSLSVSGAPYPQLSQNAPETNQCTITNPYEYPSIMTLTAVVNTSCGSPVTLTMTVISESSSGSQQTGSYYQEACTFYGVNHPTQSGPLGGAIFLNQGCMAEITLDNGVGKTVSFISPGPSPISNPLYWNYSGNTLYLRLPLGSGGIPFTFKVTGDGACYEEKSLLFFSCSNNVSCLENSLFSVSPNPSINSITIQRISASNSDNEQIVKMKQQASKNMVRVELFDFKNGGLVGSYQIEDEKLIIDTKKFKKGKYILHILENGEIVLNEQLIFK